MPLSILYHRLNSCIEKKFTLTSTKFFEKFYLMSHTALVICKPTNWFKSRVALMLAMFLGFAGWFYVDGNTGYRKKNKTYYLNQKFEQAEAAFSEQNKLYTTLAEAHGTPETDP